MAFLPAPNTVIPCSISSQILTAKPLSISPVVLSGVDALQVSAGSVALVLGDTMTLSLNAVSTFNLMVTLANTAHTVTLYQNSTLVTSFTGSVAISNLGLINPTQSDIYTIRIFIGVGVAANTPILTFNCQRTPVFSSFVDESDLAPQLKSLVSAGQVSYMLDSNGQYIFTFTNALLTPALFDPLFYFPLLELYNTLVGGTLNVTPQGMIASYMNSTTMNFTGNQNLIAALQWNGIAFPATGVSGTITVGIAGVGVPVFSPLVPFQYFNNIAASGSVPPQPFSAAKTSMLAASSTAATVVPTPALARSVSFVKLEQVPGGGSSSIEFQTPSNAKVFKRDAMTSLLE